MIQVLVLLKTFRIGYFVIKTDLGKFTESDLNFRSTDKYFNRKLKIHLK